MIFFLFSFYLSGLQETEKFRTHLLNKFSKKDIYGESVEEVVGICTEVDSLSPTNFLLFAQVSGLLEWV